MCEILCKNIFTDPLRFPKPSKPNSSFATSLAAPLWSNEALPWRLHLDLTRILPKPSIWVLKRYDLDVVLVGLRGRSLAVCFGTLTGFHGNHPFGYGNGTIWMWFWSACGGEPWRLDLAPGWDFTEIVHLGMETVRFGYGFARAQRKHTFAHRMDVFLNENKHRQSPPSCPHPQRPTRPRARSSCGCA